MNIVVTGATGLLGCALLRRMAQDRPDARFIALVRSPGRWRALAPSLGPLVQRVTALRADLRLPGLGLSQRDRALVQARADAVIHCAADVCFSRSLADARAVNTEGTRRMLELAEAARVERFAYISTAFVAGRRVGTIGTDLRLPRDGWVNAYEQSKFEAEQAVRAAAVPSVVFRPAIVVADDDGGRVSQYNSAHRALFLCYSGLAALMPGSDDTPVDVVTAEYVARAVAELVFRDEVIGSAYHLCAGTRALRLGELLDRSYAVWARDPQWRRRCTPRPALTDLGTYREFEEAVAETADTRLRVITRAMSHFAPQLSYPKLFDTSATDALLGYSAPPSASFWDAMIEQLLAGHWTGEFGRAA